MSNNKQTAVEWLEDKFDKFLAYYEGHHKAEPYSIVELSNDFFKAKEMEKQQIIETAMNCFCEGKYSAEYTEEKISSSELIKYAQEYFEQIYHGKESNN